MSAGVKRIHWLLCGKQNRAGKQGGGRGPREEAAAVIHAGPSGSSAWDRNGQVLEVL